MSSDESFTYSSKKDARLGFTEEDEINDSVNKSKHKKESGKVSQIPKNQSVIPDANRRLSVK